MIRGGSGGVWSWRRRAEGLELKAEGLELECYLREGMSYE